MAIFNLNNTEPEETPASLSELTSLDSSAAQSESVKQPTPRRAWVKTLQAVFVMTAALLGWHEWMNPGAGMDARVIVESFKLHVPQAPAGPLVGIKTTVGGHVSTSSGGGEALKSKLLVDDAGELNEFFGALWKLESAPKSGVLTVLHYGDSPTTADLITGDVRAGLQDRFGDGGRGYTLIAKPWPWYGHRGVELSGHGWTAKTGVGLMREGVYGLGGASFEGGVGAGSSYRLTESQQASAEIEFLAKPNGGTVSVSADGVELKRIETAAEVTEARRERVELPAGTKSVEVHPVAGNVQLFGIDFRRGPGLIYDSLGLNGATTSVLARTQPPGLWKEELASARPQLIVVNYGSNESSFGNFVHKQYADELRLAIRRLRVAAPGVPILIMSPMDRGERTGLDEIHTMATIPEIVEIQRRVAAETHCAFFDTYDAMGGDGTIARWYVETPRLVTADLLHPTPQGAAVVAGVFVDELSLGYDRWKAHNGIEISPIHEAATRFAKAAVMGAKRGAAVAHAERKAGAKKNHKQR